MNTATKPLKTIFSEAIEIADPAERGRYLAEACGADAELRHHAEELIAAHSKAMSFLDAAKTEQPPTVIASTPLTEREGSLIGRYKLLEKLGEGGFGAVYVAEQREPVKRRVALKIIKLGMDTKHVVARFEAERQALAMMDHPHIARVLDAGSTDTGRPYFVMELVRGQAITKYCDDNNLPTRERLDLFLKVCNAIQHAHQKGIIHRDIKPSNVMVTLHDGVPVPKVIDFGIAKATQGELTEKTVYTQFQQFIGTPAYMSPEQAEMSGLDVDTRSDIYSLGVLLYELLIGKTPFDGKELMMSGLDEMRRTLREKEPLKPSTRLRGMADDESSTTAKRRGADLPKLMHLLRGDLDWIVMKCLEKDRTRRYDTANGLAMDIQRHLTHEPVAARPPSRFYRLQKMVRRNKIAFTAATVVGLVLIAGLISTTLGWRVARIERDNAIRARQDAEKARAGEKAQRQQAEQARELEAEERRKAEQSELAARKNLYAADMLLAQQALAENDRGRALRLLDQHRPRLHQAELRGWEWRHLWRLCQSDELATVGMHSNSVWVVRASPDGRLLASVDLDNTLKVWNGQLRWEITNLTSSVQITAIAFSTDGSLLAIADSKGRVKLCDPTTLRESGSLHHSNRVDTLTFSADGKTLATVSQNQFRQWDVKSRREIKVRDLPHGDVWFFNFGRKDCISPDSRTVAVGTKEDDGTILLWDLERGFVRSTIHRFRATALTFSADGKFLAASTETRRDYRVSIWEVSSGRHVADLPEQKDYVWSLAFSPDGRVLTTACLDQTLTVWDTKSWEKVARLRGHLDEVWDIAYSPDGRTLTSSSKDGSIRLWSTAPQHREEKRLEFPTELSRLEVSPDAKHVFTLSTNLARVYQSYPLRELGSFPIAPTNITSAAISINARLVALGDDHGLIRILDSDTQTSKAEWRWTTNQIWRITFSPNTRRLAAASSSGKLGLWDLETTRLIAEIDAPGSQLSGLRFSPDGDTLATRLEERGVALWRAGDGKLLAELKAHKWGVIGIAFSSDGRHLVSTSQDGSARVWDLTTHAPTARFRSQLKSIYAAAFSPDGNRLAIDTDGGPVKLFDLANRQEVAALSGHTSAPIPKIFFLDHDTIMAAGWKDVVVWRAAPVAEIDAAEKAQAERR